MQTLMHSLITFLDITALAALTGAVWCILLPGQSTGYPQAFQERMQRLLTACIIALIISSCAGLAQRTAEMSGHDVISSLPLLPAVLFKTHYGKMWFLRFGGVLIVCILLCVSKRHRGSRAMAAFMLCALSAIAFGRSASGHPADFGDLSPQQLADWLHLLAAASWGGTLLALAGIFPVPPVADDREQQRLIAGIANRFYTFFGPVVSVLVLTGVYNAWFEAGSIRLLLTTPYGRALSVKIALLLFLAVRYIAPPDEKQDTAVYAMSFIRRSRVEAMIILVVLFCASLLTHSIPAKHYFHLKHSEEPGIHDMHTHGGTAGSEPVVTLETEPLKITAGSPVKMIVYIKNRDGSPFKDVIVQHERIIHTIIVGKDLNVFAHIHPEDISPVTDEMTHKAAFPLRFTFPMAGEYLVGIDFATSDNMYAKHFSVIVAGEPKMKSAKTDLSMKKSFGRYTVKFTAAPKTIRAGEQITLRYFIEEDGKAATDLEPYLGAYMHLAIVPDDLKTFIHAHGISPEDSPAHQDHQHAAPPKLFGPEIDADVVFPGKGVYKIFSQVKHHGKVLLFDFMVNVN